LIFVDTFHTVLQTILVDVVVNSDCIAVSPTDNHSCTGLSAQLEHQIFT